MEEGRPRQALLGYPLPIYPREMEPVPYRERPERRFREMREGGGYRGMQEGGYGEMRGGRYREMEEDGYGQVRGGRYRDMAEGRYRQDLRYVETPEGRYRDMPEGRYRNMPEGRYRDMPQDRYRDMPEGRYRDMSEGRYRDMPEDRYRDMPEDRYRDMPDDSYRDMPEGRYREGGPEGRPIPGERHRDIPENSHKKMQDRYLEMQAAKYRELQESNSGENCEIRDPRIRRRYEDECKKLQGILKPPVVDNNVNNPDEIVLKKQPEQKIEVRKFDQQQKAIVPSTSQCTPGIRVKTLQTAKASNEEKVSLTPTELKKNKRKGQKPTDIKKNVIKLLQPLLILEKIDEKMVEAYTNLNQKEKDLLLQKAGINKNERIVMPQKVGVKRNEGKIMREQRNIKGNEGKLLQGQTNVIEIEKKITQVKTGVEKPEGGEMEAQTDIRKNERKMQQAQADFGKNDGNEQRTETDLRKNEGKVQTDSTDNEGETLVENAEYTDNEERLSEEQAGVKMNEQKTLREESDFSGNKIQVLQTRNGINANEGETDFERKEVQMSQSHTDSRKNELEEMNSISASCPDGNEGTAISDLIKNYGEEENVGGVGKVVEKEIQSERDFFNVLTRSKSTIEAERSEAGENFGKNNEKECAQVEPENSKHYEMFQAVERENKELSQIQQSEDLMTQQHQKSIPEVSFDKGRSSQNIGLVAAKSNHVHVAGYENNVPSVEVRSNTNYLNTETTLSNERCSTSLASEARNSPSLSINVGNNCSVTAEMLGNVKQGEVVKKKSTALDDAIRNFVATEAEKSKKNQPLIETISNQEPPPVETARKYDSVSNAVEKWNEEKPRQLSTTSYSFANDLYGGEREEGELSPEFSENVAKVYAAENERNSKTFKPIASIKKDHLIKEYEEFGKCLNEILDGSKCSDEQEMESNAKGSGSGQGIQGSFSVNAEGMMKNVSDKFKNLLPAKVNNNNADTGKEISAEKENIVGESEAKIASSDAGKNEDSSLKADGSRDTKRSSPRKKSRERSHSSQGDRSRRRSSVDSRGSSRRRSSDSRRSYRRSSSRSRSYRSSSRSRRGSSHSSSRSRRSSRRRRSSSSRRRSSSSRRRRSSSRRSSRRRSSSDRRRSSSSRRSSRSRSSSRRRSYSSRRRSSSSRRRSYSSRRRSSSSRRRSSSSRRRSYSSRRRSSSSRRRSYSSRRRSSSSRRSSAGKSDKSSRRHRSSSKRKSSSNREENSNARKSSSERKSSSSKKRSSSQRRGRSPQRRERPPRRAKSSEKLDNLPQNQEKNSLQTQNSENPSQKRSWENSLQKKIAVAGNKIAQGEHCENTKDEKQRALTLVERQMKLISQHIVSQNDTSDGVSGNRISKWESSRSRSPDSRGSSSESEDESKRRKKTEARYKEGHKDQTGRTKKELSNDEKESNAREDLSGRKMLTLDEMEAFLDRLRSKNKSKVKSSDTRVSNANLKKRKVEKTETEHISRRKRSHSSHRKRSHSSHRKRSHSSHRKRSRSPHRKHDYLSHRKQNYSSRRKPEYVSQRPLPTQSEDEEVLQLNDKKRMFLELLKGEDKNSKPQGNWGRRFLDRMGPNEDGPNQGSQSYLKGIRSDEELNWINNENQRSAADEDLEALEKEQELLEELNEKENEKRLYFQSKKNNIWKKSEKATKQRIASISKKKGNEGDLPSEEPKSVTTKHKELEKLKGKENVGKTHKAEKSKENNEIELNNQLKREGKHGKKVSEFDSNKLLSKSNKRDTKMNKKGKVIPSEEDDSEMDLDEANLLKRQWRKANRKALSDFTQTSESDSMQNYLLKKKLNLIKKSDSEILKQALKIKKGQKMLKRREDVEDVGYRSDISELHLPTKLLLKKLKARKKRVVISESETSDSDLCNERKLLKMLILKRKAKDLQSKNRLLLMKKRIAAKMLRLKRRAMNEPSEAESSDLELMRQKILQKLRGKNKKVISETDESDKEFRRTLRRKGNEEISQESESSESNAKEKRKRHMKTKSKKLKPASGESEESEIDLKQQKLLMKLKAKQKAKLLAYKSEESDSDIVEKRLVKRSGMKSRRKPVISEQDSSDSNLKLPKKIKTSQESKQRVGESKISGLALKEENNLKKLQAVQKAKLMARRKATAERKEFLKSLIAKKKAKYLAYQQKTELDKKEEDENSLPTNVPNIRGKKSLREKPIDQDANLDQMEAFLENLRSTKIDLKEAKLYELAISKPDLKESKFLDKVRAKRKAKLMASVPEKGGNLAKGKKYNEGLKQQRIKRHLAERLKVSELDAKKLKLLKKMKAEREAITSSGQPGTAKTNFKNQKIAMNKACDNFSFTKDGNLELNAEYGLETTEEFTGNQGTNSATHLRKQLPNGKPFDVSFAFKDSRIKQNEGSTIDVNDSSAAKALSTRQAQALLNSVRAKKKTKALPAKNATEG